MKIYMYVINNSNNNKQDISWKKLENGFNFHFYGFNVKYLYIENTTTTYLKRQRGKKKPGLKIGFD